MLPAQPELRTRNLPAWVFGFPNAIFGLAQVYVFVAVPILLASESVPVGRIASVTAVAGSPIAWAFLLCPILDVQFTRRTYAFALGIVTALCLAASVWLLHDLRWLTCVLAVGMTTGLMTTTALNGWKSEFLSQEQVPAVCGWNWAASLGAGGIFSGVAVWLLRTLPIGAASASIAIVAILPLTAALLFPRSTVLTRSASIVFSVFFHDLFRLCRQRRCLYGLLIFLLPEASFAFAFGAVGKDFHVSEHLVALVSGPLAGFACVAGCLLGIPVCRRFSARFGYIVPGLVAAVVTLTMMFAPKNAVSFTAGCSIYMMMQGMNFTSFDTLAFQIAGRANPLAATLMSMLAGVSNLSIVMMKATDGHSYTRFGINGMLAWDGLIAIATGVPLLLFLRHSHKRGYEAEEVASPLASESGALPA